MTSSGARAEMFVPAERDPRGLGPATGDERTLLVVFLAAGAPRWN
ncbi:hypothetical protein [Streptomyces sp. NPDC001222]